MTASSTLLVCVLRARSLPNLDLNERYGAQNGPDAFAAVVLNQDTKGACYSSPEDSNQHPDIYKCCEYGEHSVGARVAVAMADADFRDTDDTIGSTCATTPEYLGAATLWAPLKLSHSAVPPPPPPTGVSPAPQPAVELLIARLPPPDSNAPGPAGLKANTRAISVSTPNEERDKSATAMCPSGASLLSCNCKSANDALCDVRITSTPARCVASLETAAAAAAAGRKPQGVLKKGDVTAVARCLPLAADSTATTGWWSKWALSVRAASSVPESHTGTEGDAVSVSCSRNGQVREVALSCSSYADPPGSAHASGVALRRGTFGESDSCVATLARADYGAKLFAQAICAEPKVGVVGGEDLVPLQVFSPSVLDPLLDSQSVRCPDGFGLVGCECDSSNDNCRGAEIVADGARDSCVARLRTQRFFWRAGGRAVASCLWLGPGLGPPPESLPVRPPAVVAVACAQDEEAAAREAARDKAWLDEGTRSAITRMSSGFFNTLVFAFLFGACAALSLRYIFTHSRHCGPTARWRADPNSPFARAANAAADASEIGAEAARRAAADVARRLGLERYGWFGGFGSTPRGAALRPSSGAPAAPLGPGGSRAERTVAMTAPLIIADSAATAARGSELHELAVAEPVLDASVGNAPVVRATRVTPPAP